MSAAEKLTAATPARLDAFDIRMMKRFGARPGFPTNEMRAFCLYERGLLARDWVAYRSSPRSVEFRWRYRLSKAGRVALEAAS